MRREQLLEDIGELVKTYGTVAVTAALSDYMSVQAQESYTLEHRPAFKRQAKMFAQLTGELAKLCRLDVQTVYGPTLLSTSSAKSRK